MNFYAKQQCQLPNLNTSFQDGSQLSSIDLVKMIETLKSPVNNVLTLKYFSMANEL